MERILGATFIVLGVFGLGWGAFEYTTQKKIVDIGPIQATKTEHHTVPVPPIAGAALLAGGLFLVSRH